jgi:antitoxin ParD1/3/4
MQRNTSVLLGDHFDKFIACELASGKYASASEVIRAGLRMLESEARKRKQLVKALQEGERSGFAKDFDPKAHLSKLNKRSL